MLRLTHGGGPHAWPLLAGSGYVLGRFDCPPHAERWHAVDWIGDQPHVVLPGTAVRIGAVGEEPGVCTANEVIVYDRDTHYRRAVVSGDTCWVSGTTDAGPDGQSRHPGAPGAQARAALDVIEHALSQAGFQVEDVVRTRMYVTDPADIPMVLEAHGERFGAIRPAATVVVVTALIEPSLLVEPPASP